MRTSGLPLLSLALAACATQEEADPFQPPARPVIYASKRECLDQKKPKKRPEPPTGMLPPRRKLPTLIGGLADGPVVVAHGGVGTPPALADGPEAAAKRALARLEQDEGALDAAVEAVVVLEDDPRFNAGTGANIRLDGKTIEMDASLMTSEGDFGAVAAIERVKNPILVARRVLETPHVLLVGEGATRFAHQLGFEDVAQISKEAEARYTARIGELRADSHRAGGPEFEWQKYWNYPNPVPKDVTNALAGRNGKKGTDTVGAVARDRAGRFAVALSTGGTALTLYGRVGDVPIFGAGGFAGPAGAVACTGDGELIVRQLLAKKVYEDIAAGVSARIAVHRAVVDFPEEGTVGIIAVDRVGYAVAASERMAFAAALGRPEDP